MSANSTIQLSVFMKKLIFLLFFPFMLTILPNVYAQQLYVWAKDGLIVRDSPSKKSQKKKTLPYGTPITFSTWNCYGGEDSVLVIPKFNKNDVAQSKGYYLRGAWRKVIIGQDSGYVFDAFLSNMVPFDHKKIKKEDSGNYGISPWLGQILGSRNNKIGSNNENFYSWTYKDHTVEYHHWGEGGGFSRFTIQCGLSFLDGFLLVNYFEDLFIDIKEAKECESFEFFADHRTFHLVTVGLEGHIYFRVDICYVNGLLVIEIAEGC